jgi:hypothetical protein
MQIRKLGLFVHFQLLASSFQPPEHRTQNIEIIYSFFAPSVCGTMVWLRGVF